MFSAKLSSACATRLCCSASAASSSPASRTVPSATSVPLRQIAAPSSRTCSPSESCSKSGAPGASISRIPAAHELERPGVREPPGRRRRDVDDRAHARSRRAPRRRRGRCRRGRRSRRPPGPSRLTRSFVRRPSRARPVIAPFIGARGGHGADELLAAEHPLELVAPLRVVEDRDPRVGRVARHLLDPEMLVGDVRDLRQVRDRQHLRPLGEPLEDAGDAVRGDAADARVDLVEHDRLAAGDRRDRERDAGELAARGGLGDRRERQPGVRPHEERRLVRAGRARARARAARRGTRPRRARGRRARAPRRRRTGRRRPRAPPRAPPARRSIARRRRPRASARAALERVAGGDASSSASAAVAPLEQLLEARGACRRRTSESRSSRSSTACARPGSASSDSANRRTSLATSPSRTTSSRSSSPTRSSSGASRSSGATARSAAAARARAPSPSSGSSASAAAAAPSPSSATCRMRSRSAAEAVLLARLEPLGVLDERGELVQPRPLRVGAALELLEPARRRRSARQASRASDRRALLVGADEGVEQRRSWWAGRASRRCANWPERASSRSVAATRSSRATLLPQANARERPSAAPGARRRARARRPGGGREAPRAPPRRRTPRAPRARPRRTPRVPAAPTAAASPFAPSSSPIACVDDRLAGAGLAGDRDEARRELELRLADQDEVLDPQSAKHAVIVDRRPVRHTCPRRARSRSSSR